MIEPTPLIQDGAAKVASVIYATVDTGSVEYDRDEAAVEIDAFVRALTEAKANGATHVLGLSGNYRGARYVKLSLPTVEEEGDW